MGASTIHGIPWPLYTDYADGPAQMQAIAERIDPRLVTPCTLASRPTPAFTGALIYLTDMKALQCWDGTQWRPVVTTYSSASTSRPIDVPAGFLQWDSDVKWLNVWDGTQYRNVWQDGPYTTRANRDGNPSDNFGANTWTEVVRVTVPAKPIGEYIIHGEASWSSQAATSVGWLRIEADPAVSLTTSDTRDDLTTAVIHSHVTTNVALPIVANTATIIKLMVNSQNQGGTIQQAGTRLIVSYNGA